jgi:hypothetical protein
MSRPYREIFGVKITNNGGKNWRTLAICQICFDELKPDQLPKKEGFAAVRSCEYCSAANIVDKPEEKPETEPSESFKGLMNAISRDAISRGKQDPFADEGLPPNDVCNLGIAFSPIIPNKFGTLEDATDDVIRINQYTYEYTVRGVPYIVSDEQLKTMRIRYIVKHNERAKQFLRENNPVGSIWHQLGSS